MNRYRQFFNPYAITQGGLSFADREALSEAIARVRRGEYSAIRFEVWDCDEAQEAHRLCPPDVPMAVSHTHLPGRCECIRGLA